MPHQRDQSKSGKSCSAWHGWIACRLWVLGLLFACVACLDTSVVEHAAATSQDTQSARFQQDVDYLASEALEGRGVTTDGIGKARDFLVSRFKQAGLRPAFEDGFTQAFDVTVEMQVNEAQLRLDDRPVGRRRFSVLGCSGSGEFAGEAIFTGYSMTHAEQGYDSYTDVDSQKLQGKVFVVYRYEPMTAEGRSRWRERGGWTQRSTLVNKAKLAAEHGAAAVIIVNPPVRAGAMFPQAGMWTDWRRVDVPVLSATHEWWLGLLRRAGHDDPRAKAEQLEQRANTDAPVIEPLGVNLAGRVKVNAERVTSHNVVGLIPGAGELKQQYVVVAAHYDHVGYGGWGSRTTAHAIHPGADDNASGTAGLLLLAEHYGKQMEGNAMPEPRRTLILAAFSAEERGAIGSRFFVDHLQQAGIPGHERIVAMMNLDMIGRLDGGPLRVTGLGSADGWASVIREAANQSGLDVQLQQYSGLSDHWSFYQRGVPAVHFFTGLHSEYHTPLDTPDKVDASGAVKVMQVVRCVVEMLWRGAVPLEHIPGGLEYTQPQPSAG